MSNHCESCNDTGKLTHYDTGEELPEVRPCPRCDRGRERMVAWATNPYHMERIVRSGIPAPIHNGSWLDTSHITPTPAKPPGYTSNPSHQRL